MNFKTIRLKMRKKNAAKGKKSKSTALMPVSIRESLVHSLAEAIEAHITVPIGKFTPGTEAYNKELVRQKDGVMLRPQSMYQWSNACKNAGDMKKDGLGPGSARNSVPNGMCTPPAGVPSEVCTALVAVPPQGVYTFHWVPEGSCTLSRVPIGESKDLIQRLHKEWYEDGAKNFQTPYQKAKEEKDELKKEIKKLRKKLEELGHKVEESETDDDTSDEEDENADFYV
jgi:uncharacterized protein YukE